MSGRTGRELRNVLLILLLCWAGISQARAQAVTATLKGRVFDSGGTGLPSVVVGCESPSHGGSKHQVVTDIEGNYRVPLLPPAEDYVVKVAYPGFAPVEAGPVALNAGKVTVLDLTLRSEKESTETVKVEARGNIVDTESTWTSSHYGSEFIEGLPIIGHNYQDVLTLAPGVTDTDGDGNPNVHGARDTGLQYRLDGGNITDPVSGSYGQSLNQDIIEEIEVITAGASAEYGRADGGFANIITKSGGNDFQGKFSLYWQGKFLNGDGANSNDINQYENTFPGYHDLRPTLSLGGAIVKDHLWYFASLEGLDTQEPVNQLGSDILVTSRGIYAFGKITWQTDSDNKLVLQVVSDSRTYRGLNLRLGTSPDSDFEFSRGGTTPQVKWTSTISPRLLLESTLTAFRSGFAVTPVSNRFEPRPTVLVSSSATRFTIQARYPCRVTNCETRLGEDTVYQIDVFDGTVAGPYFHRTDDTRVRAALKTDLSISAEDFLGQHNIKAGIEFAEEEFRDEPIQNPILVDETTSRRAFGSSTGGSNPLEVSGDQVLLTFQPLVTPQRASSFNSSVYLLDSWKPVPNLSVNLGIRLDREDTDTSGFESFDPRQERRKAIKLWDVICEEVQAQNLGTAACLNHLPGNPPNNVPDNALMTFRDSDGDGVNDVDPRIVALDLNGNGIVSVSGAEGLAQFAAFTTFRQRETRNFSIDNMNLSPRLSVSWDPFSDGKTKIFSSWSRYYDRLFLGTITGEIGPDSLNFVFLPHAVTHWISPGAVSRAASTVSVTQIDRDLRTPRTDEFTFGIERELAPEWSIGLTYVKRRGYDLLQDVDLNHLTCGQYDDLFGIDPMLVCGDAGHLETDRFGKVGFRDPDAFGIVGGSFLSPGVNQPNGAPDLYTVNTYFNQVFRIGNFNSSDYEAYELKIVKRLHRNWQMQASYTWSEAFGQAETFDSGVGDDPQTKDDEDGYLDYDQRHVLKFQAVTRLPHEITLGTSVQWASGTPYSIIAVVGDLDQTGNVNFRQFYPTTQRNDQRNLGQWKIDARLEKGFVLRKATASAYLLAENLTNSDDLVILSNNLAARNGIRLNAYRNFGRRWEIGTVLNF
ncbi:MAG TPA: carboxypeptidase regulatory-like domain-containing protein [Candidatus Polarisedimenticolia bacterium]|jgi:hypothetical protein